MTVKSSPFPKVPTWWDWSQVELCFSIKIPIVPRTLAGIESKSEWRDLGSSFIWWWYQVAVSLYHQLTLWLYHITLPQDFITLHKTLSHYTRLYHITLPLNNVVPNLGLSFTHFEPSHCVIMTSLTNGPWTHLLNLVTVLLRTWKFVRIFVLLRKLIL